MVVPKSIETRVVIVGTRFIPTFFFIECYSKIRCRDEPCSYNNYPWFLYFLALPSLASSPGHSQFFNVAH